MGQPARPSLWARTRVAVQEKVADVALDLFIDQGFETTTVDEIVAAAGISRRSFFRYFGSKEDIVLGDTAMQGRLFSEALGSRPANEDPWTALRRAADSLPGSRHSQARAYAIARLVVASPSLIARHAVKRTEWRQLLTPVLQERLGLPAQPTDVRAMAIVASALACLDAATEAWVADGGQQSLDALYGQALDAVRS